jgi:hypothetical protein
MFAASKTDSVSGAAPDAQFNQVTMLLHGDGTNGAQNNTILDSGPNNFTITRYGNTTQGSFSPYGSNWSNYFGDSNYLTIPNDLDLAAGTGSFTLEFWYNSTSTAEGRPTGNGTGGTYNAGKWALTSNLTAGKLEFYVRNYNASAAMFSSTSSTVASDGLWHHIVLVRSSNTWAMFIDGARQGSSITSSVSFNGSASAAAIGWDNIAGDPPFLGYLSDYRFVIGTAVYDPSQTTLTVPTSPLTAITNTKILTCQSNRFKDNSSINFPLTIAGSPSVQRFNPFGTSTAYSTSVIGGSGYFDGDVDYISAGSNAAFSFGTGTYTVEAWVYISKTGDNTLFCNESTNGFQLFFNYSDNTTRLEGFNGSSVITFNKIPTRNSWTHVALVREGTGTNQTKLYFNGALQASGTDATNWTVTGTMRIGGVSSNSKYLKGYITDARIVKGTAVYTAAFTSPTAPLTAISGTSLLTKFQNAAIFDNAMMNDLETVGEVQISTSVKKYGTGSLLFDGNDFLLAASTPNTDFGYGDFTIEAWINRSTESGTNNNIFQKGLTASSNFQLNLSINPSNQLFSFYSTDGSSITTIGTTSTTIPQYTWTHVAVSRSGSTWRYFINGTLQTTTTAAVTLFTGTGLVSVGANPEGNSGFYGYIDDLRVTKGYARYTASFTPPTAALSDTGPY